MALDFMVMLKPYRSAPVAFMRFLACAAALVYATFACAQTDPPTSDALQSRITQLEAATEPDQTTRSAAIERYREALGALQRAEEFTARLAEWNRLTAEAPAFLDALRAELAAPPTDPTIPHTIDSPLTELEQALAQAQTDLIAARQQAEQWQSETTRRVERRPIVQDLITQLRARALELDESLRSLASSEPGVLRDARLALAASERFAVSREIESLEAEIRTYDARREVTPARRDRALRQVSSAEKLIERYQRLVSERRQRDAQNAASEAERLRREVARQNPALQNFAAQSKSLADLRVGRYGTAQRIDTSRTELTSRRAALLSMRDGYQGLRMRIDAMGLNRATGILLRRQYDALPSIPDLRRSLKTVQQHLADAEVTLIERREERSAAGDINAAISELLLQIGTIESEAARADFETVARELAVNRRDILDSLVADAETHFNILVELEAVTQKYLAAATAYLDFIEQRIFWIRSIASDFPPAPADFATAGRAALDLTTWRSAFDIAWQSIIPRAPVIAPLVITIFLAFYFAHRARRTLASVAQKVSSYRSDSFKLSIRALLLTIIITIPWPLLLWALGWIISSPIDQNSLGIAAGAGLQAAAAYSLWLLLIRHLVRSNSLFESHFRWPTPTLRSIRANLHWFITPTLIAYATSEAIARTGDEALIATFGRFAFTLHMLLLASFLARILRPSGPAMSEYRKRNPLSAIDRLRFIWFPLLVTLPIAFAVVSWLGYHYTSLQLEYRFETSLVLVAGLILLNAMLQRWLFIARRRVAIEDARRRREAAKPDTPSVEGAPVEDEKLDLPAISAQTRQLFRVAIVLTAILGLLAVWASVLPALKMFDRVQVWPRIQLSERDDAERVPALELVPLADLTPQASQPQPAPEQPAQTSPAALPTPLASDTTANEVSSPLVVTLADLGLAIIILIATTLAFRNLPGLVEIVVLQRLPLDAGSRYALSTVLRYIIAIIGISIAFNTIGISWGKVQWLAAALTFGLAFGLQEIFANFVSGLIILAERPIRVGDTVTVGGVSGTVARIRMRATTITDWDRKELIIPNRTFITDQVINWTLTDPVLRVVVPVGVSYDSDIHLVQKLLLDIATAHECVIPDPAPQALFIGFGDSTLNFELRCHIGTISDIVRTRHTLHVAILTQFREHNIEIAFPQRDLHLRTSDATIQILRKDGSATDVNVD